MNGNYLHEVQIGKGWTELLSRRNSMCKGPVAEPCVLQKFSVSSVPRKANSELLRDQIDEVSLPGPYK